MSQIQEIKEKLDIIEVVGERIKLERSGKNFRAVCPFHSEKTPSFFVSPELQRFICFGCRRKGDVLTFIQEYDRLTFPETLEVAAQKAGVELQKDWQDPKESQRKRLFEILELAQKYYTYLLQEHGIGTAARNYLQERGMNQQTVKAFGMGYAPDKWEGLVNYLTKKKQFDLQDVIDTGLAIKGKRGGAYDRFRGRIMFPLHDHRGRVVGFSGRVLDAEAKEAKYINTPETEIYHKRYLLYGYWQNLEAIRDKEAVIIMEGEFDVLSSVQAHVRHVVAVKGSALTEEQIRILSRTVKTIYLALDADSAGVEATKRAIELVQPFPVTLRVIPITGGKDPDDLARNDPKQWRAVIQNYQSAFDYVLDHTMQQHDMSTAHGQKEITNTMLTLLLKVEHAVERAFYIKQLAEKLKIPEHVLEEQWQQVRRKQEAQPTRAARREPDRDDPTEEEASGSDATGRYLIQLLLQNAPQRELTLIPEWLEEPALRRILSAYLDWRQRYQTFDLQQFSQQLPDELQELTSQLYLTAVEIDPKLRSRELNVTTAQLQQRFRKQRVAQLQKQLARLENKDALTDTEEDEYQRLQQELQQQLKS